MMDVIVAAVEYIGEFASLVNNTDDTTCKMWNILANIYGEVTQT